MNNSKREGEIMLYRALPVAALTANLHMMLNTGTLASKMMEWLITLVTTFVIVLLWHQVRD